ncbi:MAG: 7TM domain-containing protein [Bacteroidota bacterium]
MLRRNAYGIVAGLLLMIPLLLVLIKQFQQRYSWQDLLPKEAYSVSYEFDMFHLPEQAFVESYLPVSNSRQRIQTVPSEEGQLVLHTTQDETGLRARWESAGQTDVVFKHEFEFEGKALTYRLPKVAPLDEYFPDSVEQYRLSTAAIQSDHPLIRAVADSLKMLGFGHTMNSNYEYVSGLANTGSNALTDALTALKRQRASCNGQSRLFVALCRAQGIPARVAGGIILEQSEKRTSHLWAEAYYRGSWIPFDVLNGHFASLPANYLELYHGDEFLISRTSEIGFDYQFVINKRHHTLSAASDHVPMLWSLLNHQSVSIDLLRTILLLPVAALLIALLKNVIGLKTFGVFLPALIALSLVGNNVYWTIGAFAVILIVISGLHYSLDRLSLLHTPKLVIMLLAVILTLLLLGQLGYRMDWDNWPSIFMLPLVIMAIAAERFAKVLTEDNFEEAVKMLGSTLLVSLLCYPVFSSELLIGVLLTFPELYLSMIGLLLLLGRWIGLRIMEHFRFSPLILSN